MRLDYKGFGLGCRVKCLGNRDVPCSAGPSFIRCICVVSRVCVCARVTATAGVSDSPRSAYPLYVFCVTCIFARAHTRTRSQNFTLLSLLSLLALLLAPSPLNPPPSPCIF